MATVSPFHGQSPVANRGIFPMDKLKSIRAFAKVIQHGSFSEAARELRTSRARLSAST